MKKIGSITTEQAERIRLFEVRQHKEYKELVPQQTFSTANLDTTYGATLVAEPIPLEEDDVNESDKLITVIHFAKEATRLHGIPVKFIVKPVSLPPSVNCKGGMRVGC